MPNIKGDSIKNLVESSRFLDYLLVSSLLCLGHEFRTERMNFHFHVTNEINQSGNIFFQFQCFLGPCFNPG